MKYLTVLAFTILIILAPLACDQPASADILGDLHNSTLTGIVPDDVRQIYIENITVFEPTGEEFLGMPLTKARLKLVTTDGKEIIHDLMLIGAISKPTDPEDEPTFYVCYRVLSEPFAINAGGIVYNFAEHWWGEDAPPVHVGLLFMDNGNPMYTLYFDYELNRILGEAANGYSIGGDLILGMETMTNRDFFDGKVYIRKDGDPEGKTYFEAFVLNNGPDTVYGIGAGITF